MKFDQKLILGKIKKRYKRFLADITLENGEAVTAHIANTGSMKTCWEPGWKVAVSYHDDPKRKLKYSLELTHNGKTWIGVNTSLPNKLAYQSILEGKIPELYGYSEIKPEATIGKSRIDLLLEANNLPDCYVEIKNVTMLANSNEAIFPDAVSERGLKHLHELAGIKRNGMRAVMLYIIQREDVEVFRPAFEIDEEYARALKEVESLGVEILAYRCQVSPEGVEIEKRLPLTFNF
ncbi:MAG: DNA/RNA nuclease SfsA [Bdellovibrio sp.]